MIDFWKKASEFFRDFGTHETMVLSTSQNDKVSSRMMSVILLDGALLFQTDRNSKKYSQIKVNPNVALCANNIQIEGICKEIGKPADNAEFCKLYKKFYPSAYELYSNSEREVLFYVEPVFIQKWIYENGKPYIETWDFISRKYEKRLYEINGE